MDASFKYPRTPHLPFSQSVQDDDRVISPEGLEHLRSGIELVVTEKMDGGNVSLYRDRFHARSVDAVAQPWDARSRGEWAARAHLIPEGVRLSGESMAARRSVSYENLPAATLLFGAWRGEDVLPWDVVCELAQLIGLPTAPVLYRGCNFDDAVSAWRRAGLSEDASEGFVVRDAGGFDRRSFALHVAKWVRAGHVQTSDDWRRRQDFTLNGIVPATV